MSHTAYLIEIDPVGSASAALIPAIGRQEITSRSEVSNDVDAGSVYPRCVTINAQKNELTFTTKDIGALLALIGTEGVAIESVKAWEIQVDPVTGRALTTATHRTLTASRGLLVPTRLTAEHHADATIDVTLYALKDNATDYTAANLPIVVETGQALPTGLTAGERYTIGPSCQVAGQSLPSNTRFEVDFGNSVTPFADNSEPWDDQCEVEVKPAVIIGGRNVAAFGATLGLAGAATTHADTDLYLRRRSKQAAGFTAAGSAHHINITAAGIAHWEQAFSAQANARVEKRIRIDTHHDGTNTPIVVATDVALP
ncbi:MAG: hypothetical protein AAFX06_21395 [Planctomycetota bacterium]